MGGYQFTRPSKGNQRPHALLGISGYLPVPNLWVISNALNTMTGCQLNNAKMAAWDTDPTGISGHVCWNQIRKAWIRNHTPQYSVSCNCLCMPQIPIIDIYISYSQIETYHCTRIISNTSHKEVGSHLIV